LGYPLILSKHNK